MVVNLLVNQFSLCRADSLRQLFTIEVGNKTFPPVVQTSGQKDTPAKGLKSQ